jgi:hypothetical protein
MSHTMMASEVTHDDSKRFLYSACSGSELRHQPRNRNLSKRCPAGSPGQWADFLSLLALPGDRGGLAGRPRLPGAGGRLLRGVLPHTEALQAARRPARAARSVVEAEAETETAEAETANDDG